MQLIAQARSCPNSHGRSMTTEGYDERRDFHNYTNGHGDLCISEGKVCRQCNEAFGTSKLLEDFSLDLRSRDLPTTAENVMHSCERMVPFALSNLAKSCNITQHEAPQSCQRSFLSFVRDSD